MSTLWCPSCRSEYREGISVCADCGVPLVTEAELPPIELEHDVALESFGPDADPVELTRASAVESEMIAAQLRGAGIPTVILGVGTGGWGSAVQFSYGSRIMVRSADLEAAQTVLDDLFDHAEPPAPINDADLAALAEESTGFSDPETGAVV